jgi:diacylglycerol kinase
MKQRIRSFGYAIRGIRLVIGSEANMKIHITVTLAVVICGFFFSISTTEWLLCLICFGLVLSSEMVNTAIENVVDLASPEQHPLAGKAKDIAAGAVLISAIFSAITGLIIFVPKGWYVLQLLMNKL